jgi:TetR/AcrR family transcriptional regulator, cholesterol catabolism regulator
VATKDGKAKPNARRQPPRRRKQEIIDAAARVFHEKGYESTSIQDIANDVGILKGSIYYYIESKEDLLYEILHTVHEEAFQKIEEAVDAEQTTLEKIRALIVTLFMFHTENLVRIGVFFSDFRSLRPERQAAIVQERDRYDRLLRTLIRQGKTEGVVCPDVDPKVTALAILGMVNWIYEWYRPGGGRSAATIAEAYGDLALAGIVCTPETHEPGHRRRIGVDQTSAVRS